METLTVACVEVGDFLGRGHEYVSKLASMCKRNLPEHRFVVLSDHEHPGIDSIVDPTLPASYWAKIHLFKPGRFTGPTLFFDLDVVISRDIGGLLELLDYGDFMAPDDFAWPIRHPRLDCTPEVEVLCGGKGTINSSVMLWRDEAGREIYERYTPEVEKLRWGDQNHVTHVMGERITLIPDGWVGSWKYGPAGTPITVYHGTPKCHEVYDPDWC